MNSAYPVSWTGECSAFTSANRADPLIQRGTVGDCEGEMIEAGAGGIELVTTPLDRLVHAEHQTAIGML